MTGPTHDPPTWMFVIAALIGVALIVIPGGLR